VREGYQARPEVWPREKLANSRSLWICWGETQRPAGMSQRVLSGMVTLRWPTRWRRRELNPRPVMLPIRPLHA